MLGVMDSRQTVLAAETGLYCIGIVDIRIDVFVGWITAQGGWLWRDGNKELVVARAQELNTPRGNHYHFVMPYVSGLM